MNKTSIDWPKFGNERLLTWNPIVGCANGCKYCYAKNMNRRFKWIPKWEVPQFFPERMKDKDLFSPVPTTVFVGSMCDIFSAGVSPKWREAVITAAGKSPQHFFIFLTKKPQMYFHHKWPGNCILGASVEHVDSPEHLARLSEISTVGRATGNLTMLSIEPIMGSFEGVDLSWISTVIVGAMTGPGALKPKPEWIASIKHPEIYWKSNIKPYMP